VEKVTSWETIVITQQICVKILIGWDFLFALRRLIPAALAELEPSRIIESSGGDG
jgi:hypothetical protein